MNYCL